MATITISAMSHIPTPQIPKDCITSIYKFLPLHSLESCCKFVSTDFYSAYDENRAYIARERLAHDMPLLENFFVERNPEALSKVDFYRVAYRQEQQDRILGPRESWNEQHEESNPDQMPNTFSLRPYMERWKLSLENTRSHEEVLEMYYMDDTSALETVFELSGEPLQTLEQVHATKYHQQLLYHTIRYVRFFDRGEFDKIPLSTGAVLEFVSPATGRIITIRVAKIRAIDCHVTALIVDCGLGRELGFVRGNVADYSFKMGDKEDQLLFAENLFGHDILHNADSGNANSEPWTDRIVTLAMNLLNSLGLDNEENHILLGDPVEFTPELLMQFMQLARSD